MSSEVAISIKEVSKIYNIYKRPQDRLWQSLFKKNKNVEQQFRAVDNVSFNIKKGECIGIIGRNGSGKSTMLQMIAGTLMPTTGEINVQGRVSALLELGSGFNPEFTGRENVIMNGVIMGLSREQVLARMPDIESFAEIGSFIDQPVKTYSSGMFVRLAFACAVHVNPEILIIDEALAVGDMRFQLKCIDKMKQFKSEGKTILFVSHDSYTVRNFCDQAIWMMDGKIHLRGDVKAVTEKYQDYMKYEGSGVKQDGEVEEAKRKDILSIDSVCFLNNKGEEQERYNFAEDIQIVIEYTLRENINGITGGVAIYDKQNNYICGLNTKLDNFSMPTKPGKYKLKLNYSNMHLLPGSYFIDIGFFESSGIVILDYKSRHQQFHIYSGEYFAEGITYLDHSWTCEENIGNHVEIQA